MLNVCGYDSYVIRGSDEHGLQGMKENSNIFRSSITARRSRFVGCISRHFEFVIRERSNGSQGQRPDYSKGKGTWKLISQTKRVCQKADEATDQWRKNEKSMNTLKFLLTEMHTARLCCCFV